MSYVQLVAPYLSATGRIGWCLEYAGRVFKTTNVEPNAWIAYLNSQFKHSGPPPDAIVPMWYSYWASINGIYANYGHVTINVPGQGIYSSPWQANTSHAVLSSIAEVEHTYGVKYVGWSEDILKVRVVKESNMPTLVDKNILEDLAVGLLGRTSVGDASLANWLGAPVEEALRGFIHYPEHQALIARAAALPGEAQAKLDAIKKLIN